MKRNALLCTALALLAGACSDGGSSSSVATTVAVTPASFSLDAVGATRVVKASVKDQNGQTMSGASLTWTSSSAAATVAPAGGDSAIVTAAGNGSATITASSGSASGTGTAQVAQVATTLQKAAGDAQSGTAGAALATPLQVRVRDRLNAPVAGATVSFTVIGGGSLSSATAVTNASGIASVTWTLGTGASVIQQVSATSGSATQVDFTATAVAGPAATAVVDAGNNQTAAQGTAVAFPPRVLVRDAFGNPVAGVNVQFTVTSGGGSVTGATQTTGANGMAAVGSWTLGASLGANTLTATFPGTALAPVVFTATAAAPGTVVISAGGNQAAMAGTAVPIAPTVLVRDAGGNPMPGQTVTFAVTDGGGIIANTTVVTNASGLASSGTWVLGPAAGPNTLSATVVGLNASAVVFRGAGCEGGGAGYTMTLCFTSTMSTTQRAAFTNAASRWSTVITADLPDVATTVAAGSCGSTSPGISMNLDDLVIFAGVEAIDGPNGVLGSAGPCLIRTGSNLPILGVMRFDAADVTSMEVNGSFGSVILHEMGHVLGIGTIWSLKGLLQNPSSAGSPLDTHYTGANGIAGFDAIGGTTYSAGQKVPVENTGGAGTMNGHWRETVLANELMTGFLNAGTNPMSLLTVRSLTDLGYTVNPSAADAFSVSLSLRAEGPEPVRLKLHNDRYTGPRYHVDRQGRLTRIPN